MIRTLPLKTMLLCLMALSALHMQAQGWMKYSQDFYQIANEVYETHDRGYLFSGFSVTNNNTIKHRVLRADANGTVLWKADFDSLSGTGFANITQDGGMAIVAMGQIDANGLSTYDLLRLDSNGHRLWKKVIYRYPNPPGQGSIGNMDIDTTDNNGLICMMTPYDSTTHSFRLLLTRLDVNGDTVWQRSYYDTAVHKVAYSIRNSMDGGFLVVAEIGNGFSHFQTLFKIDGNGNFLWEIRPTSTYLLAVTIARDRNILLLKTGQATRDNNIIKLDQNGSVIWAQTYPTLPDTSRFFNKIIELSDHSFSIMCQMVDSVNRRHLTFYQVDSLGHILHSRRLPTVNLGLDDLSIGNSKAFQRTTDGGYIQGGTIFTNIAGAGLQIGQPFLIKMDSMGQVYPSTLSGQVFADNNNCAIDSGELLMRSVYVTLTSAQDTFTVVTADSGYFNLGLDTGVYSIHVAPSSPYWLASSCNMPGIRLATGTDSAIVLGVNPIVQSPYVEINGYMFHMRQCRPAIYTSEYCNTGTTPFTGVIQLTVDSLLQVDSASTPWLAHSGNIYSFAVNGLGVMECARIDLYVTVSCTADPRAVACINAKAYQDTILNVSPLWDKSNLRMSVAYNNVTDTITFSLDNKGSGTMSSPRNMIVIEDNVILLTIPVQLPGGGQYLHKMKANGATWRATIPQTPLNPYSTFTTAAIERVGTNQQGGVSLGYFTQFPYNGFTSYEYNTCEQIRNSFDPNEKEVSPIGSGPSHLIDTNVALEYAVHFQNTGNDTAFVVKIVDTLSPYLDPATLRKVASSSPCSIELNKNVVTFTFYPILLPDSGHDQLHSNGFVKFRINQKPGNAIGTEINNKAGIYFDYNAPVITNTATVRIGQVLLTDIQAVYADKKIQIAAYPNPFNTATCIKIEGEHFNELMLSVYDMNGRLVKQQIAQNADQIILERSGLSGGIYTFELSAGGKPVGTGKILVQ